VFLHRRVAGSRGWLSGLGSVDFFAFLCQLSLDPPGRKAKMTNGFLDDLPDGFLDDLPDLDILRRRRKKSTPAEPYFPKPVDCRSVRQKLVVALADNGTLQNWQARITKIIQESKNYDQKWAKDPDNPFPVLWLKNGLPCDVKRGRFNELSRGDYTHWRRIVKELTDLNIIQGSEKVLKIFDEKQKEYRGGNRCFSFRELNISKILDDESLICFALGVYHDLVCYPKVVTGEIRNLDPDTHDWVMYFAGQLTQAELETLLAYAESKGLLEPAKPKTNRTKKKSDTIPGRPRKYSDEKLTLALKLFKKEYLKTNDAKTAWSEVASTYGFPSGEAARKRCEAYAKNHKTGQN